MAALLAVFAAFEREILGERVRAGLAHARQNGKRLGRPLTAVSMPARSVNFIAPESASLKSPAVSTSVALPCVVSWTGEPKYEQHPEFHKIWIDQCAATEGIREKFGLEDALNYLIGEKLFSFPHAA